MMAVLVSLTTATAVWQTSVAYASDPVFRRNPDWVSVEAERIGRCAGLRDVNGDGFIDAIGASQESGTVFLNQQGEFDFVQKWHHSAILGAYDLAFSDVDGDGRDDIVCATPDGCFTVRNLGDSWDGPVSQTFGAGDYAFAVDVGDIDNDGDLDVVVGNFLSSNRLYLNHDGVFSQSYDWQSADESRTYAVELADIDNDGFVDLICGNGQLGAGEPNTVYMNNGGVLDGNPDLISTSALATADIALGDIDGDGDLDLICANSNGASRIYANLGGVFSAAAIWDSGTETRFSEVEIVDVDGDDDLDVVFGGASTRLALYVNDNGTIDSLPAWQSSASFNLRSLDLADTDRDGDLDIVCYGSDGVFRQFVNDGGMIAEQPAWTRGFGSAPTGIVTTDMNGDGFRDVIVVDEQPRIRTYLNNGALLETTFDWELYPDGSINDIAVGDLDGDGQPDIVCATGTEAGDRNRAYANTGSSFSSVPLWESTPSRQTNAAVLGDVDGDGDLDLLCANGEVSNHQKSSIYFNVNGTLETSPGWSSLLSRYTESAVLADINGNGYDDVILGSWDGIQLYPNTGTAVDSLPRWQGVDVGAVSCMVARDLDTDGDIDLVCGGLADVVLYRNDGTGLGAAPDWQIETAGIVKQIVAADFDSDGNVDLLLASTWGTTSVIELYLNQGMDFDRSAALTILHDFSITAAAGVDTDRDGDSDVILGSGYQADNGLHLYLTRWNMEPLLDTSMDVLAFPAVTLGDTVSTLLSLDNVGQEVLMVDTISVPSAEMRFSPAPPFAIDPGQAVSVDVHVEPRQDLIIDGSLLITSNDFATPRRHVPIDVPIRPLLVEQQIIMTDERLPLGESAVITIAPVDNARLEGGSIHYRRAGVGSAFADSVPIAPWQQGFIGIIPGAHVTESGLEYYLSFHNSGIRATEPAGAPHDSVLYAPVSPPTQVSVSPLPNSGLQFLSGLPVAVSVALETGTLLVDGALQFRRGGESRYNRTPLQGTAPHFTATIPEEYVSHRGVEFYLEVDTESGSYTSPVQDPADNPHSLSVTVRDAQESPVNDLKRYRMVSVPFDFGDRADITLESLVAEQPDLGTYDPVRWRAFRYNPQGSAYEELNPLADNELFELQPGKSFWFISRSGALIDTKPVTALSVSTDRSYEINLLPGWNQIGSPFAFAVDWNSVLVDGVPVADDGGNVLEGPRSWSAESGWYDATTLLPWRGCWLYNASGYSIVLSVPADEATETLANGPVRIPLNGVEYGTPGWTVGIDVQIPGDFSDRVTLGAAVGSSNKWDPRDRLSIPPRPDERIRLSIPHGEWPQRPGQYSVDIRNLDGPHPQDPCHLWNISARAVGGSVDLEGDACLTFYEVQSLPENLTAVMIDRKLSRIVDLRSTHRYHFLPGPGSVSDECRFMVAIGDSAAVAHELERVTSAPARTVLRQNHPNPFNPATIVAFEIGRTCHTSVKIYDLAGKSVRTMVHEPLVAGRYEYLWQGTDDRGRKMPSGMYICRMIAGDYRRTVKMTLIR